MRKAALLPLLAACWLIEVSCGGDNPTGPTDFSQPAPPPVPQRPVTVAPPVAAAAAKVAPALPLYDPRDRSFLPPGGVREPKLAPDVEKQVLSVLSASYKTKREECQGKDDVYYKVGYSIPGSFTAAAASETAYVVEAMFCEPPGTQPVASWNLLIFNGDKKVAQATGKSPGDATRPGGFYGMEIHARPDLDGDTIKELVITSVETGSDGFEEAVRVYSAKAGEVKLLKEFPKVYVNACKAAAKPDIRAQVLLYGLASLGVPPEFAAQTYTAPCPASGDPVLADFKLLPPPGTPTPAPSPALSPAAGASPVPSASGSPAASPTPASPAPASPTETPSPAAASPVASPPSPSPTPSP
jgi:hypothetical protein